MPRPNQYSAGIGFAETRLQCRPGAPEAVREIFEEIVASVGSDHFATVDAALLEQYSQAIALARRAYAELDASGPVVDGKQSPWLVTLEKAHRSAVALAARLRLCPQSRFDRLKAGTTSRDIRPVRVDFTRAFGDSE